MTLYYNNKPIHADLVFKVGETIDISYEIMKWDNTTETWLAFDLTGKQIEVMFRRKDGLLVKSLSNIGSPSQIGVLANVYTMNDTPFLDANLLDYDVKVTDGGDVFYMQEGMALVKKKITT